jgi:hypothetical protein
VFSDDLILPSDDPIWSPAEIKEESMLAGADDLAGEGLVSDLLSLLVLQKLL